MIAYSFKILIPLLMARMSDRRSPSYPYASDVLDKVFLFVRTVVWGTDKSTPSLAPAISGSLSNPPTLLPTSHFIAPRSLHRTSIHIANRLRSYSAPLPPVSASLHSAGCPTSAGIRCSSTEQDPHLAVHGDHPGPYAPEAASNPKVPLDFRLPRPSGF